ncbi:hypothetical protein DL95DRAFT_368996 [Leptodontidium sp. 2 PMI_412]|nr:hypothetical protein BKA61DRAFT_607509 [Leptodontidium sp. MPI-SDFR-AT-0119]KAH9211985.1 hypothetical protein DL95DRAFT_368996 [Leptodontidium sp. 2 PMI_412]
MVSFSFVRKILVITALASVVAADARNWNPTGQGCVDTDGFLSCYQSRVDDAVGCVKACNSTTKAGTELNQNCILGCNGAWLAGNIGCWIQGCWNQVYSCEYQMAAISYFSDLDLVQNANVPFYPPPDNAAAGACSCNLGYVWGNKTYTNTNMACLNVAANGNRDALNACQCCQFSFPLSNIFNVCPTSDLSLFGIDNEIAAARKLIEQSNDNCAILETSPDTCVTELGFPYAGTKIVNLLNLPTGIPGSDPLVNNPGNAFTDFGSPSYTLSLFPSYSTVIKPAAFNTKAGAGTQTVSGTITGQASGSVSAVNTVSAPGTPSTGSGSGTAAAASPTKTSDATRKHVGFCVVFLVLLSGLI